MRSLIRIAQIISIAVVLLANLATANAAVATMSKSAGVLKFTSDPGLANSVIISQSGTMLVITDSGAAINANLIATGCQPQSPHTVHCPLAGITRFEAWLNDLGDNFWSLVSLPTHVYGEAGDDNVITGPGDDRLYGGTGSDILRGSEGADNLYGEDNGTGGAAAGNNSLFGGEGHDALIGGDKKDTMDGGPGAGSDYIDCMAGPRDVVTYADAPAGITIALQLPDWQQTGGAGLDWLRNCEDLIGSAFGDLFEGDGSDNQLWGNGGVDTLKGFDGTDWLSGGNDTDYLYGGNGADFLYGDAGNDQLYDNINDWAFNDNVVEGVMDCGSGTQDYAQFQLWPLQPHTGCEAHP
jgi:hypothetical protein